MKKNKKALTVRGFFSDVILRAGLLLVLFLIPVETITAETKPATDAPCDLHINTCTQPLSGSAGTVTLAVSPKPVTAMTDLVFTVRFSGISPKEAPYIDLGMPGMKMGPNRVSLKESESGVFTGSGIIVRCGSGKTLWQVTITVPGAGTAEFPVNVVY